MKAKHSTEHYFSCAMESHQKSCKARAKNPEYSYFTEKLMDSIDNSYCNARGHFNDYFHKIQSREAVLSFPSVLDQTVRQEQPSVAYKNLPVINIEPFPGKHCEWEKFRNIYPGFVYRCEKLSDIDKFLFLVTHVKGKASEIVNRYKISEEIYEDAWNALITYYENPRRLVQTHLSALYAVKQMKSESYISFNRLYEGIFIPLNALKT